MNDIILPTRFNFNFFTYPKENHILSFSKKEYDILLKGFKLKIPMLTCKAYEDMLVSSFILENIPKGSKILDIGGGKSRVLNFFKKNGYECWNLDKLQGANGGTPIEQLTEKDKNNCKFVLSYIGEFSKELPDNYFDFVFSISTLEHVPREEKVMVNVLNDLQRITKSTGYNLHCIDFFCKNQQAKWVSPIIKFFFDNTKSFNYHIDPNEIAKKSDLWIESEEVFIKYYVSKFGNKAYDMGRGTCYSILW